MWGGGWENAAHGGSEDADSTEHMEVEQTKENKSGSKHQIKPENRPAKLFSVSGRYRSFTQVKAPVQQSKITPLQIKVHFISWGRERFCEESQAKKV